MQLNLRLDQFFKKEKDHLLERWWPPWMPRTWPMTVAPSRIKQEKKSTTISLKVTSHLEKTNLYLVASDSNSITIFLKQTQSKARSLLKLVTIKQQLRFCDDEMVKKLAIHVCVTVWCVTEACEVHCQKRVRVATSYQTIARERTSRPKLPGAY